MGDLLSHPPVIKIFDFTLQVDEVAARSKQEGSEPAREWFDGVFLAMPNSVSLQIQINDIRGLIRVLAIVKAGDSSIFSSLDPLGRVEDSITQGNVELQGLAVINNISFGGLFEGAFVVLDVIL
jgi:hypothetical protein